MHVYETRVIYMCVYDKYIIIYIYSQVNIEVPKYGPSYEQERKHLQRNH